MNTCIIYITAFALCYSNMFRPSKGHQQGVEWYFLQPDQQNVYQAYCQFIQQSIVLNAT